MRTTAARLLWTLARVISIFIRTGKVDERVSASSRREPSRWHPQLTVEVTSWPGCPGLAAVSAAAMSPTLAVHRSYQIVLEPPLTTVA